MSTTKERNSFSNSIQEGLDFLNNFLVTHGLSKSHVILDHVCFKCSSHEEYEQTKLLLMPQNIEPLTDWMYESWISGRRITIARFKEIFAFQVIGLGAIPYLELQDQKPDGSQQSGCDHVEIVPHGTQNVKDLVKILRMKGCVIIENEKPHHTTYDITETLQSGNKFSIKLSSELLIKKIKREEMK